MSTDISCNENARQHYQRRFPWGRWNNTNTNLKLFPKTICEDQNGKKIVKQTRNLFSNTSVNMSQKQIFAYLVRNGIGPRTR